MVLKIRITFYSILFYSMLLLHAYSMYAVICAWLNIISKFSQHNGRKRSFYVQ